MPLPSIAELREKTRQARHRESPEYKAERVIDQIITLLGNEANHNREEAVVMETCTAVVETHIDDPEKNLTPIAKVVWEALKKADLKPFLRSNNYGAYSMCVSWKETDS